MKAIILCGGKGQRIGSDILHLPKALMPIEERPLVLYTMERYIAAGITDFVLCGGYMVEKLQDYFCECSSVVRQTSQYSCYCINLLGTECMVEIWNTGLDVCKTERICTVLNRVEDDIFFISYCDCVSDIDIECLLAQHKKTNAWMTLTVVNPVSRYGHVVCNDDMALAMEEKPVLRDVWINGGFMAVLPEMAKVFREFGVERDLESDIMPELARLGRLAVYRHTGFWRNIETQKDVAELTEHLLG